MLGKDAARLTDLPSSKRRRFDREPADAKENQP